MMKRTMTISIIVVALLALSGCLLNPPVYTLLLTVTPDVGYPPLDVTLLATGPTGGQYTFVVEGCTYQQSSGVLRVTVQRLPCEAYVTWISGANTLMDSVTIRLSNAGPVIGRPVLKGIVNLWWIIPRERYIVTFPDTFDPEGGPVTLVDASVRTEGSVNEPNTIFCPPYVGKNPPKPDVYHVHTGTHLLQNAFVFYSIWNGPLDTQSGSMTASNLPYPPPDLSEAGYPGGHACHKGWPTISRPGGFTIIEATFEDEMGAQTTERWSIPTSPYPGC